METEEGIKPIDGEVAAPCFSHLATQSYLNMVGYCILSLLQEPNKPQVHSVITRPFKKNGEKVVHLDCVKTTFPDGMGLGHLPNIHGADIRART